MATEQRLSTREMITDLGITRRTIMRWIDAGLPHRKRPGRTGALSFARSDVIAWMERVGASGVQDDPLPFGKILKGPVSRQTPTAAGTLEQAPPETDNPRPPMPGETDVARLTRLVNLQIKKLEERKRRRVERVADGALLDAAVVAEGRAQRIAIVRQGLLALPGKMGARLAGREPREIQAELEREVRRMLSQFAAEFRPLA